MDKAKIVFLLVTAGILILFTSFFASAETALKIESTEEENGTYSPNCFGYLTNACSNTQSMVEEIRLCLENLTSTLQRLEFRLFLMNQNLNDRAEEYTFLHPAVDATNESIEVLDSIVHSMKSDSNSLDNVNSTLSSLNEDLVSLDRKITSFNEKASLINSRFHSNLEYIENVSKRVNSTFEETNFMKNITADMNKTVEDSITFLNNFRGHHLL